MDGCTSICRARSRTSPSTSESRNRATTCSSSTWTTATCTARCRLAVRLRRNRTAAPARRASEARRKRRSVSGRRLGVLLTVLAAELAAMRLHFGHVGVELLLLIRSEDPAEGGSVRRELLLHLRPLLRHQPIRRRGVTRLACLPHRIELGVSGSAVGRHRRVLRLLELGELRLLRVREGDVLEQRVFHHARSARTAAAS